MGDLNTDHFEYRENVNVKLAKNLVTNELPSNLTLGGIPVAGCDVANSFAKHFSDKIKLNVSKTSINQNGVYNGKCKEYQTST